MKRIHLKNPADLLKALSVLQEDFSEKDRQRSMSRRLRGKINEEDDDEKDDKKEKKKDDSSDDLFKDDLGKEDKEADDKDADDAGGSVADPGGSGGGGGLESGSKDKPKDDKPPSDDSSKEKSKPKKDFKGRGNLPGAKRLEDAELRRGQKPTTKDIIQRINFLRAGASLKDDKVKKDISTWIAQLREPERLAVYTSLDAIAKIMLARKSPAEAPTFTHPSSLQIKDTKGQSSTTTQQSTQKQSTPVQANREVGPLPITVGEGVVRKLKEVDVPVKSGKKVAYGSKAHLSDLEQRIEDLERIRSYQEHGSDSRHALGVAIKSLKSQLKSARKRNAPQEESQQKTKEK